MLVSLHWVLVCIPGWPAGTCADVSGWPLGSCVGISGWPLGTSADVPGWPLDTRADVAGWPLGTCAHVPGWPLGTCMSSTAFSLKRRSVRRWGGRPAWVHWPLPSEANPFLQQSRAWEYPVLWLVKISWPVSVSIARPPHEPTAILSCTPGLAGYPFDPTQLWHG